MTTHASVRPNSGNGGYAGGSNDDGGEEEDGDSFGSPSSSSGLPQSLRRFSAGEFQINRFLGALGVMEVTDWEYYTQNFDEDGCGGNSKGDAARRKKVRVNPLDPTTPTRTVEKSDASVRLFEGFDYSGKRVLLKEFVGSAVSSSSLSSLSSSDTLSLEQELSKLAAAAGGSSNSKSSGKSSSNSKSSATLKVAIAEASSLEALKESWFRRASFGEGNRPSQPQPTDEDNDGNTDGGGGNWLRGGSEVEDSALSSSKLTSTSTSTSRRAEASAAARAFALAGASNEQNVVKADANAAAPFVTLLGCIDGTVGTTDVFASKDFVKGWRRAFPEVQPPLPGNVWLVFRWEGFGNTVKRWPKVPQQYQPMDALMPQLKVERRSRFVKAACRSSLEALAFLHESGLVHRSLGPGSLLLSTEDERDAKKATAVKVKLTDFGFASKLSDAALDPNLRRRFLEKTSTATETSSETSTATSMSSFSALAAFATGEDLHALGLVFLELVFSSLARKGDDNGSGLATADMDTFQRLYTDVFEGDIQRLRNFCAEEASWEDAVAVLDKKGNNGDGRSVGGGWGGGSMKWSQEVESLLPSSSSSSSSENEQSLGDGWLLMGLLLSATARGGWVGGSGGVVAVTARDLLASPFLVQR